jgi:hypothetical protein
VAAAEHVADDEALYRRVLPGRSYYTVVGGVATPSSQAFTDRRRRPSVDRARLLGGDPRFTQGDTANAVLHLMACDIRGVGTVTQMDDKGRPVLTHALDVKPEPLPDNPAHAQVQATPELANERTYRRMLEALARLAQWSIPPQELR